MIATYTNVIHLTSITIKQIKGGDNLWWDDLSAMVWRCTHTDKNAWSTSNSNFQNM